MTAKKPYEDSDDRPTADQIPHDSWHERFTISDPRAVVLLVEDNEESIVTVADYLKFKEFHVIIARTGRQALDLACALRPDIILMDIQMPELDGLEAIRRLKGMPEMAGTPIVALTALAMIGDRERCLAAGADHYLSKPVSLRELHQVITRQIKLKAV